MQKRHLATAALLLTLALGACGEGDTGSKPAIAPPPTEPTAVAGAAPSTGDRTPPVSVRTDDLEAELRAVDGELSGAEQSVNQANDASPERVDD
jgi:hypothetical protein